MIKTKGRKRFLVIGLLALWLVAWTIFQLHCLPAAQAASGDTIADRVLGQPNFVSSTANNPALASSAAEISHPNGLTVDWASGRLFLADTYNHRILSWPSSSAFSIGQGADLVIGQPDFDSKAINAGGLSASSLSNPIAVTVDRSGNLYVADLGNSRVLEYEPPFSNGMAARRVFGQADFTSDSFTPGAVNASTLGSPNSVAVDSKGNLYVADVSAHRVVEFNNPLHDDNVADRVFGQPNLTGYTANYNGITASSLYTPNAVAVDNNDNLYVADSNNHRVLEYDSPLTNNVADRVFGQAGSFTTGTANKNGLSANSLNYPIGLAWDPAGNLFVADRGNNRVLEYDNPLTNDTTADWVFGQGGSFTTGTANKNGLSASSLYMPSGVVLDSRRNLLASDYANNRVLEYDTPIANSAPTISSLGPSAVAIGAGDFTLVVNGVNFVYPAAVRWNGADRPTTFLSPWRLTASIPAADIATAGVGTISVVSAGIDASASKPLSIYSRTSLDTTADRVLGQPNFASNAWNSSALLPGGALSSPSGLAIDRTSGRLFVAEESNNRVLSWPNELSFVNGQAADLVLGQPNFDTTTRETTATSLGLPQGVAIEGNGRLFVADYFNSRVVVYAPPFSNGMAASLVLGQGDLTTGTANYGGLGAASLYEPAGLAFDGLGNLYVSDFGNNRVLEYNAPFHTGMSASRLFGQPNFNSNNANNGGLGAASLFHPGGLALDPSGNLYVADGYNHRVLEYDSPLTGDAVADRVFGQPNLTSSLADNGGVGGASLYWPQGVGFDPAGNFYIADQFNNRVLEYDNPLTNDTTADRVFGQPNLNSNAGNSGGLSVSSLSHPFSLLFDRSQSLLVVDQGNNRVLEYDRPLAIPYQVYLPAVLRGYAGGW